MMRGILSTQYQKTAPRTYTPLALMSETVMRGVRKRDFKPVISQAPGVVTNMRD